MKKVILIAVAAVVLIVGGLFAYVSMIDWNSHKNTIANQFSNVTGKEVVFEGPVSFKVFPSPYLSAENIRIYDKNRSANPDALATIRHMQVDLSLISLFSGNFDVRRMVISEPEMIIEILPEGKINWQSPINFDNADNRIDVVLDSVTIKNATVHFISKADNINITLSNLNAEVNGESIFGPYRIEGTYIKGDSPEGFAVSLGKFSDSFATPLTFAVTHPRSNTFMKFDGSFFLKNAAVTGDVLFSSEKFVEFLNSYFNLNVDPFFDKKTEVSLTLNTNRTKIDISNFIIKYGNNVGVGNVLIPLREQTFNDDNNAQKERLKSEVSFNITELELEPVVKLLDIARRHYENKDAKFAVDFGYDILFDMKSHKTSYKEQSVKDLTVSLDILQDTIIINSIGAAFPGDTLYTQKGKIFALEDVLTYNMDFSIKSSDVFKAAQWLGYEIPTVNQFTYRNAELVTNVSGNLKNIKISPFSLKIDKSVLEGELGIVRGDRINMLIDMSVDTINFDNYLEKTPPNIASQGIEAQVNYWIGKLEFLNDYDMQFDTNLGLGITSATPFENANLSFKLKNGIMDLKNLNISSIKNSTVEFKGEVKGFGEKVDVSNLRYNLNTQNFYSVFPEETLPSLLRRVNDFKKFEAKGVVTGGFSRFATKSVMKLDNIELSYSGNFQNVNGTHTYDGKVEFRTPDFVKFVNRFGLRYTPKVISMGVLRHKSSVKGTYDDFELKDSETFIGANKFTGDIKFRLIADIPNIETELKVDRFEFDRFFYNPNRVSETPGNFVVQKQTAAEFLAKPAFDNVLIDFTPFTKINLNGKFNVDILSYEDMLFNNAAFGLDIGNSQIKIKDFSAVYNTVPLSANTTIELAVDNKISGNIVFSGKKINGLFKGTKFGLENGVLDTTIVFNSSAKSEAEFAKNLSGNFKFKVANPVVFGWNFDAIAQDLLTRTTFDGLASFVAENLQKGRTEFAEFDGEILLNNGNYSLKDTVFSSDKYNVPVTASGSIDLWDITSSFIIEIAAINDLPPVGFSLNGSLASPEVVVNVEEIGNVYQQRKDAEIAAEKKKEADELDKIIFLMGEQQDRAKLISKDITAKKDFINKRIALAEDNVISADYKNMLKRLENIENEILDVIETINKDELLYTSEMIQKSKITNDMAEQELKTIQPQIDNIYLSDLRDLVNSKYSLIASKFRTTRSNIVSYRDKFVEYPKRMAVLGKVNIFNEDMKIKELRNQIEEIFNRLDAKNSGAAQDYVNIQTIFSAEEFEKYLSKINAMLEEYDDEDAKLNTVINDITSYAEEMVSEEEIEYAKIAEEELKKQKVEESKGTISTSTGKNVTVFKDIDEIERDEEIKQKENIPVLDFSKSSSTNKTITKTKTIITKEEVTTKVTGSSTDEGFLKKIEGEISGASGSVIKK